MLPFKKHLLEGLAAALGGALPMDGPPVPGGLPTLDELQLSIPACLQARAGAGPRTLRPLLPRRRRLPLPLPRRRA